MTLRPPCLLHRVAVVIVFCVVTVIWFPVDMLLRLRMGVAFAAITLGLWRLLH